MPRIKVAIGVEPQFSDEYNDEIDERIRSLVQSRKAHAIGACGLEPNAGDVQMRAFTSQIEIASEHGLPLIVQANGAHALVFDVLESKGFPFSKVLVRAFDGTDVELAMWTEAGSYLSFGGNSEDGREELGRRVALVPVDHVLVESCAPQETIKRLAGYPSRCDQVVFVAEAINMLVDARQLAANTEAFYGL